MFHFLSTRLMLSSAQQHLPYVVVFIESTGECDPDTIPRNLRRTCRQRRPFACEEPSRDDSTTFIDGAIYHGRYIKHLQPHWSHLSPSVVPRTRLSCVRKWMCRRSRLSRLWCEYVLAAWNIETVNESLISLFSAVVSVTPAKWRLNRKVLFKLDMIDDSIRLEARPGLIAHAYRAIGLSKVDSCKSSSPEWLRLGISVIKKNIQRMIAALYHLEWVG